MAKNVAVTDVFGNVYEATYPKRAKGLVKNGRARFVDDNTICLVCPPDEFYSEDFFMEHNMNKEELLRQAQELNRQAEALLAEAEKMSDQAEEQADEASDLWDEAIDLRDEANDLRNEARELRQEAAEPETTDAEALCSKADQLDAEAKTKEQEADEKEQEATAMESETEGERAKADKAKQQAEYLKQQAKRMFTAMGEACEEAGERVKEFVHDHQGEIDAAKDAAIRAAVAAKDALKKAFDTTKKYAGEAWDYAGRHLNEFEKAAAEATTDAADKTREAARELRDKAQEKFRDARAPRPPFGEPPMEPHGPKPELSMEYLLGELSRLNGESRAMQDALEQIREKDPLGSNAEALSRMIEAREATNRELIKTYTKMYEDLRAYPYWSASQRLQELRLIQQQFGNAAPEGFIENLTAQMLSDIYLKKD